MRTRLQLLVIGLFGLLFSCRGCGQKGPDSLLQIPPPDATALLRVPDLTRAADKLEGFITRATRKTGSAVVTRVRAGFVQQLGFDPLDPAGFDKWGIDAKQGLVFFTEGSRPEPVLALAVKEGKKLDVALQSLASKVDGADKVVVEKHGQVSLHKAGRPFGDEVVPVLVWAHIGSFALVARPEGQPSLLAAAERFGKRDDAGDAAAKKPRSLVEDPVYKELLAKVPAGEITLFVRGSAAGAALAAQTGQAAGAPLSRGMAVSLALGPEGLAVDSFLALALPGLDKAMASEPALPLARRVEPDAVVVALTRHARADALAVLRRQPAIAKLIDQAMAEVSNAVGLDPEKDILPQLAGPATASLQVTDLADLPGQLRGPNRGGLLDHLHVVMRAELRDPVAMEALLERSAAKLAERGITIEVKEHTVDGNKVKVFAPAGTTRLGWAVVGSSYVYAAGPGVIDQAIAAAGKKDDGSGALASLQDSVAKQLAEKPATSVIVVRPQVLAKAAQSLGAAAGAGGMALLGGVLDVLRTIGDVAVGLSAEPDGLRVSVREKLQ